MSSTTMPDGMSGSRAGNVSTAVDSSLLRAVQLLASLKLTCVLFILAMLIVFVGSLAQARRDVWQVMAEYFRTYVAWIQIRDLFPPSMFGSYGDDLANSLGRFGRIPFPGGWTIGWIMLANLTAAHVLRFRIRAEGLKLGAGIGLTMAGLAMTWLVIATGNSQTGVEMANSLLTENQIWLLLLAVLAGSGIASVAAAMLLKKNSTLSRGVLLAIGVLLLSVLLYFVIGGENAKLHVSSMRILWQLLKGSACSLVLLLGCNLLFEKRGGIALLHFGVALLMISELQVGLLAKENMLSLVEGESSVFVRDIRERELAIIVPKSETEDRVIVIPEAKLLQSADAGAKAGTSTPGSDAIAAKQVISLAEHDVPFDVVIREFHRNSRIRGLLPDDQIRSDDGLSSFAAVDRLEPVTGMDDSHDQSALYADLVDRSSGKVFQTILVSQNVSELRRVPLSEKVSYNGNDYHFYLRFQRNYRDYEVKLIDVSRTNYVGSSTPRDYRSEIEITDRHEGTTEKFTLWMNNPLRYKGETFYQSGFQELEGGREASTISVVRNTGWMLPYIACMIVSFGMFAQFGQTLFRFLDRSERMSTRAVTSADSGAQASAGLRSPTSEVRPGFAPAGSGTVPEQRDGSSRFLTHWMIPCTVTLIFAAWIGSKARTPAENPDAMNLFGFAQLPIAWSGRTQPVDSVARTQLLITAHKSTFEGEMEAGELGAPSRRELLLKTVTRAWPNISFSELETFNGDYTQWIDRITELTAAEQDTVEARMRPLMVRRMPAVHWFLDAITRPNVAARHRVIKIDDDQVLSLLGLEKRSGMTYSLTEIRKNLKELEGILKRARQKQREKQENSMDIIERRVAALFDSVGRIDQLSQMFLMRESRDFLDAYVHCWRVLRLLGRESAVMAVPTGAEEERQSWETLVGANAVQQLNAQMKKAGVTSLDELMRLLEESLPKELLTSSVRGSYEILARGVRDNEAETTDAAEVRRRAQEAARRIDSGFLRDVLSLIAESPVDQTPDQIADAVTADRAAEIASERISSELFQAFTMLSESDPPDRRLMEIRRRLQLLGTEEPTQLTRAMNRELAALIWEDIGQRAGHLLPGGVNFEIFDESSQSMQTVLSAWRDGDVSAFNAGVKEYSGFLSSVQMPHVNSRTVRLEAWFNYFEPFMKAIYVFIPVIILSFLGWLFFGDVLRRTSLFLLLLGFVVHTGALVLRMYISGRPPVTNLYSSAIFIGWAVVVAAFVVEVILKNGVGNILGAASGASALMIAHYLAIGEGDTLGVMQAVLDTQFWLATHVVCITLGYAATFLAGIIGLFYCVQAATGWLLATDRSKTDLRAALKECGKLVYGTLCFALFFSLVGTVLGGLWADDSWGRFWGWDPKENGAMLIVLWNAVILHARWDRMISDYGTSVLAMAGNIVTAWSWFGVNELKAGLHTYGFTEGRLMALGIFAAVQFAIIIGFTLTARRARSRLTGTELT